MAEDEDASTRSPRGHGARQIESTVSWNANNLLVHEKEGNKKTIIT
jgi:hypothetical protein